LLETTIPHKTNILIPTRTRFVLEATVNRLEEMGPTNENHVGGAHFCKLACVEGY